MTLVQYESWQKAILSDCLRTGNCVPMNSRDAYCRNGGATSMRCDYHSCPRRRYYKTDGMVTVTQSGNDTTVILWDDALRVSLSPDRVRFLGKALTELSEKLDAEKGVTA